MKRRSALTRIVLPVALLALAAGAVLVPPSPGSATAQPEPTLTISPSSGPCDATVEVTGHDFPPNTAIRLDMGHPGGDGKLGKLASLTSDSTGRFALGVELGALGCEAARLIKELGTGSEELWIFADLEERIVEPGRGIPPILTRTPYTATTTRVGAQPLADALPDTGSGPAPSSMPLARLGLTGLLAGVGALLLVGAFVTRDRAASR